MERKFVKLLEDSYVSGSARKGDTVDASHLSDAQIDALVKAKKATRVEMRDAGTAEDSGAQARIVELERQLASPLTVASLSEASVETVAERLESGAWDADTVEALERSGGKRKGVAEAVARARESQKGA